MDKSVLSLHLRDRFMSGDDSAYSEIYNLYARDLFAFGLAMEIKIEVVEDAIHDVFVEIYEHRNNLAKVANLKYYFLVAFRNRLFYLLKRESSNSYELSEFDLKDKQQDSLELWIEKDYETEKKLLVKSLLSKLNANQREAVYHRFTEGLSYQEIATLMNINYQSAKNLVHRAINKMKLMEEPQK